MQLAMKEVKTLSRFALKSDIMFTTSLHRQTGNPDHPNSVRKKVQDDGNESRPIPFFAPHPKPTVFNVVT